MTYLYRFDGGSARTGDAVFYAVLSNTGHGDDIVMPERGNSICMEDRCSSSLEGIHHQISFLSAIRYETDTILHLTMILNPGLIWFAQPIRWVHYHNSPRG
jgi:hypothetical protein